MNQIDVSQLHSVPFVDVGMVCLCEHSAGWVPVLVTVAAGYHARIWNQRRNIDRWVAIRNLLAWDERLGDEASYRRVLERSLQNVA